MFRHTVRSKCGVVLDSNNNTNHFCGPGCEHCECLCRLAGDALQPDHIYLWCVGGLQQFVPALTTDAPTGIRLEYIYTYLQSRYE